MLKKFYQTFAGRYYPGQFYFDGDKGDSGAGGSKVTVEVDASRALQQIEDSKKKNPEIDVKEIESNARKAEQTRTREIMAIGEKHELRELAKTFIDNGKPLEEFRTAVLDELEKRGKIKKVDGSANIGMNEREISQFSFLRAIKALASGRRSEAAFEFEMSEAVEKKLGKSARGIMVPLDVLMHRAPVDEMMKRVLTVGTASAGGNLKGTDFLAASFIELLRNRMLIKQLGAITLDGLIGDLAIPSQTGACQAYWVGEDTNITAESAPTFGQATMIVHTMGAYVDIARKLLLQSSPSVDQLIRNDLIAVLARETDRVAINGAHASAEPNGILNTSGIGSVAGGTDGAAPTEDHIIDLETEVAIDNADVGSLAYLTNPKVRGKLKKTFTNETYGSIKVWQKGSRSGVGDLNGYDAHATNQVPSNLVKNASGAVCSAIIFGNFADLIMGFWGALDLNVDTASLSLKGGLRVVAFQDMDVAIRVAASFAAMKDALTA